jgi:hypothetical protein
MSTFEEIMNASDKYKTLWQNASDEEKQRVAQIFADINIKNSNKINTKNFAKQIINKLNEKTSKIIKMIYSKSINGLIYAPTQVGKSAATYEFIKMCFESEIPVIISTDNKTDQQEQLYNRIKKKFGGLDMNVKMLKVADKKGFEDDLENCIETKNNRFVIFCLDNASQVKKVITLLTSLYMRYNKMSHINKLVIIHDEADTVTKDNNIDNKHDDQAASHRMWLELKDLFTTSMTNIDLKRIFVTATPENCVMLYKIDCPDVMKLEIPVTYTGYQDIEHVAMEDDSQIKQLIRNEVSRIENEGTHEAILYCIDRKVTDGHDRILFELADTMDCVVSTYNGQGIKTYMRSDKKINQFRKLLKEFQIQYDRDYNFFHIKNMTIRQFYNMLKKIGERCVITIGKDLICRGISYVGEDTIDPITATTLFYKPGVSMHCIGIAQTIGRITGCAMPSLKRRLYAPKDVYDTYVRYNQNQEKYISEISKSNEDTITKTVMNDLIFNKIYRSVDRPKLALKLKMREEIERSENESENESEIESESERSESENDKEEDRMKMLINNWWNKKSIIGKILSFVYENNDGVNEKELKEFIHECGSKDVNKMYHHLITKTKEYNLVFERKNDITKLKQKAREFINIK